MISLNEEIEKSNSYEVHEVPDQNNRKFGKQSQKNIQVSKQNSTMIEKNPQKSENQSANFQLKHENNIWTRKEQKKVFDMYKKIGSKWTIIATELEHKSENSVKNKFYGSIRKLLRKINAVGKDEKKLKKPLKYQSLMKPLEAIQLTWSGYQGFQEQSTELRINILDKASQSSSELSKQEALNLIVKVHKFNLVTRSLKFKKNRSHCIQKDICSTKSIESKKKMTLLNSSLAKTSPSICEQAYKMKMEQQVSSRNLQSNTNIDQVTENRKQDELSKGRAQDQKREMKDYTNLFFSGQKVHEDEEIFNFLSLNYEPCQLWGL